MTISMDSISCGRKNFIQNTTNEKAQEPKYQISSFLIDIGSMINHNFPIAWDDHMTMNLMINIEILGIHPPHY